LQKKLSKKYRLIQSLRILSQTFFFALFFYLLLKTHFPGEDYIGQVEIFFYFDPLLALTTLIASRAVFFSFILASVTILLTVILGRVVCGWVCPLGSIHQFFSFLFKKSKLLHSQKKKKQKIFYLSFKYYILFFVLVGTVFSLNLVGFIDPLSLLYRSLTVSFLPALSYGFNALLGLIYEVHFFSLADSLVQFYENLAVNSIFTQGFLIGIIFSGLILLNLAHERFWCRYFCPLGALLGIFSRWNIFKLRINSQQCIECGLCNLHCQTEAHPFPQKDWRSSECDYCFTCAAICPTSAIGFPGQLLPEDISAINLSRRKLIFSSILGVLAIPFFRFSSSAKRASPQLIRPPGALPEKQFLQKCVRCGECMKACPTNALQPVLGEAGPEGLWTTIGYCEYYCCLCSQVCPTGAIKELTVEEKLNVIIGTAFVDKNRCIPYNLGTNCIVCEEHCPTSPKAIKLVKIEVKQPDGTIKTPLAPVVEIEKCIGCAICENKCPVVDQPGIYVTSVGESRSEKNQLLLPLIPTEE